VVLYLTYALEVFILEYNILAQTYINMQLQSIDQSAKRILAQACPNDMYKRILLKCHAENSDEGQSILVSQRVLVLQNLY
jgi:hypothetical protein